MGRHFKLYSQNQNNPSDKGDHSLMINEQMNIVMIFMKKK